MVKNAQPKILVGQDSFFSPTKRRLLKDIIEDNFKIENFHKTYKLAYSENNKKDLETFENLMRKIENHFETGLVVPESKILA